MVGITKDWHCVMSVRNGFERCGICDFLDNKVREIIFEKATFDIFVIAFSAKGVKSFEISGGQFTANRRGDIGVLKNFGARGLTKTV